jgi:hypothetical protein
VTDESRLESSAEFNDDPQWSLVFLEHYNALCLKKSNDEELLVREMDRDVIGFAPNYIVEI